MNPNTGMQTCDVCGQQRFPKDIAIQKNKRTMPGSNQQVEERIRYCRDKAECTNAAPKATLIGAKRTALAGRQRRAVGE